jgi:hypothetical protein
MNSWDHLKAARKAKADLNAIMKKADPASGVSFCVRRGVARDNEDVEDDHVMRPWVTIELSNLELATEAAKALSKGLDESIAFWVKATRRDIEEAQKVLEG